MPPLQPNTRSTTIKRILQEHKELIKDPSDDFVAHPLEDDLFDWHVTLKGAPGGDYDGGVLCYINDYILQRCTNESVLV
jgi:ubiquitin-protein ligase